MNLAKLVTNWGGFEKLVAQLHETGEVKVENNVKLRGRSGAPREIDVLLRHKQGLYEHLVVVECKYWNSSVGRAEVDALVQTVREVGASRGVIFSTKGFQSGAISQAKHDAIDLFIVRDLTDLEWGLPGRVVDLFLQVIQIAIGNIKTQGAVALAATNDAIANEPLALNLEFGAQGPVSSTPTLKRDGVTLGPSLEQYIFDAAQQSAQSLKTFTINGGAECTRYVRRPTNLLPTTPFVLPTRFLLVSIPKISFDLGIKIAQSRITVDRAEKYLFALAVENCISGIVSAASRAHSDHHASLAELKTVEPDPSQGRPLINGSVLRVFLAPLFPFEEMEGLEPGPHLDF